MSIRVRIQTCVEIGFIAGWKSCPLNMNSHKELIS